MIGCNVEARIVWSRRIWEWLGMFEMDVVGRKVLKTVFVSDHFCMWIVIRSYK